MGFEGTIRGAISFEIEAVGDLNARATSAVIVPVVVHIVPTPPRHRRLLYRTKPEPSGPPRPFH